MAFRVRMTTGRGPTGGGNSAHQSSTRRMAAPILAVVIRRQFCKEL